MAEFNVPLHEGDRNPCESAEWLDSLDFALEDGGEDRVRFLFQRLAEHAHRRGVELPFTANTPYINTIPADKQPVYPGNRELERRIKSIIRWNAMAMVVRANREEAGIGGHISTFASAATLYEVGFNHFFRGRQNDHDGDIIYFQGHASPGIYSRAFLEGRLSEQDLRNFRRELASGGGLSSYPHPWLMPNFWEFPTVSMGLAPIMAIYQARLNRYLMDRGLKDTSNSRVWAFLGDGETDEPETLGAITLASRERLDNLTFVINCNLQRLDGPVRGNGKIIQELEGAFRGAGWNVIKVIWGGDWDPLLNSKYGDLLARRMMEVVDGEYQKYTVSDGAYIREHFFGRSPELLELVSNLSDDYLRTMRRGGHDPEKVYAAFQAACQTNGRPTVILAKTIKGYGLGEAGEGRNITHQQKKLNEEELREFRTRFGIPISDEDVAEAPFYKPPEDSDEMQYLRQQREKLGGPVPTRNADRCPTLKTPTVEDYKEFLAGSDGREVSTTMAFVRMLGKMLRDKEIGKYLVPIVPDESRTFGMEALFRQCGIYAHSGQLYEPVDSDTMLYYREAKDGQILEEGITEAGSMASFIAAGTAHSTHAVPMIPVFIYYSMFGFQRVADMIWAACDARAKGFLIGGTAGRTTLNGEGLQHEDGHSHLFSSAFPTIRSYDPAYGYEIATIFTDGMKRMYQDQETCLYYLTVENENYVQPAMPDGASEGILKGMYKLQSFQGKKNGPAVTLLGSGAILRMTLQAAEMLSETYGVSCDVYAATSYTELRREAQAVERENRLHPDKKAKASYIEDLLAEAKGPVIAASDYVKAVPEQIARWVPGGLTALGTDGFGRSDSRAALRRFFEVDAESIVVAALYELAKREEFKMSDVAKAIEELDIDPDKPNPLTV
jgi:pyruvate dehydrogenase E1 component